jgi:hypothetical protein
MMTGQSLRKPARELQSSISSAPEKIYHLFGPLPKNVSFQQLVQRLGAFKKIHNKNAKII